MLSVCGDDMRENKKLKACVRLTGGGSQPQASGSSVGYPDEGSSVSAVIGPVFIVPPQQLLDINNYLYLLAVSAGHQKTVSFHCSMKQVELLLLITHLCESRVVLCILPKHLIH